MRVALDRQGGIDTGVTALVTSSEPVRVAIDEITPSIAPTRCCSTRPAFASVYDEARARHPDADDVLLVNDRGEITESTIANVAVFLGRALDHPALDAGLLPGVGREVAFEEGWLEEGTISIEDLAHADAVELVSDVRGRRRVRVID